MFGLAEMEKVEEKTTKRVYRSVLYQESSF